MSEPTQDEAEKGTAIGLSSEESDNGLLERDEESVAIDRSTSIVDQGNNEK